jgi:hypothetical protein
LEAFWELHTVCEDGFDLGLVALLKLDDWPSYKGGQHVRYELEEASLPISVHKPL